MTLNKKILRAVDAVRRICHCDACGAELLQTPRGSVCGDWQCSASPIAPTQPPPAAVRDAHLRAAGYTPVSAIRPAMPTLQKAKPVSAEHPEEDPRLVAQRAREQAENQAIIARGFILSLEEEIEREARQGPRDRLDALTSLNADADEYARRLRPRGPR